MRRLTTLLTTVSVLIPTACWAQQLPGLPTVGQMNKAFHIKPNDANQIKSSDQTASSRGLSDDDDGAAGSGGMAAPSVAAAHSAAPLHSPPAVHLAPAHMASAKAPETPAGNMGAVDATPAQKSEAAAAASGSDASNPCSEAAGACAFDLPFPSGSAELTAEVKSRLELLGLVLQNPNAAPMRFKIEGHTDTVGSRDFNQTLSLQRAKAVVSYLVERYGIDPSRLVPDGKGKDNLLFPTADQTPEPKNRMVKVLRISA